MSNVTTLLKYSLKSNGAKSFYYDIISNVANYYYTFGKSTPWEPEQTAAEAASETSLTTSILDDTNPQSVSDTYSYELETRRNIQYVKQINPNDIAIVTKRYNWTLGLIYDQYDEYTSDKPSYTGAAQLSAARFYVLTDEMNVYKCLYNNKNAASGVKPTGTSPYPFTTADGYIWKFMYSIPISLRNKFLNTRYMPVVTSLNEQFYGNGSIRSFRINKRGKGYQRNTWKVQSVRVISSGTGYTTGGTVLQFAPAPQSGTTALATVGSVGPAGEILTVTVNNKGSGYRIQPALTIASAPTGAQGAIFEVTYERVYTTGYTQVVITGDGHSLLNPYSIKTVSIANRGVFSSIPTGELFSFVSPNVSYGQEPDIDVTFRTITGSSPTQYEIDTVVVNSGGFGYDAPLLWDVNALSPALEAGGAVLNFNVDTQKNEATAIALINSLGEITAIQVTDPGVNYSYASVQVVGRKNFTINGDVFLAIQSEDPEAISPLTGIYDPGFTKAEVILSFTVGNADSKQSNVELLAVDGSIEVIEVDAGGTGFSASSILTVVGDGVGCTCTPIVDDNGQLSRIVVTNPGSKYRFASVTVTGGGTDAVIRPIISPKGGHGKDAVEELYARSLLFTGRLVNEVHQGYPITNDYRQITIIKDLANYGEDLYYNASNGSACALLTFKKTTTNDSIAPFIQKDSILRYSVDANKYVTVVEKVTTATGYKILVSLDTNYLPLTSHNLTFTSSGAAYTIQIDEVLNPTIDKYSGQMLYIDNRMPFVSTDERIVVVNTLITL